MADEEISECCEHINTVPKESKAITEFALHTSDIKRIIPWVTC